MPLGLKVDGSGQNVDLPIGSIAAASWDRLTFTYFIPASPTGNIAIVQRDGGINSLRLVFGTSVVQWAGVGTNRSFTYNEDAINTFEIVKTAEGVYAYYCNGTQVATGVGNGNTSMFSNMLFVYESQAFGAISLEFSLSGTPTYLWSAEAAAGTGSTLPDTAGTQDGTLIGFATDDSQWQTYGSVVSTPNFSLSGTPQYGAVLSGSFADLSAAPNDYITIVDGPYSVQVPITVTITDAPTNTGTFVTNSALALPAAPAPSATTSVSGNAWQVSPIEVDVTLNGHTIAATIDPPSGFAVVTVPASPNTDVFTASGWQPADLPSEGEQLLYETRDGTTVDSELNIDTNAVDDELHFYLIRLDAARTVESFWVTSDNIEAYAEGSGGPAPNQSPTAVATAPASGQAGQTIYLDGTTSLDSDGSIVSYAWTQTAGSVSVTLSDASTSIASLVVPQLEADEVFDFQLTVTDNNGATSTDTVSVNFLEYAQAVEISGAVPNRTAVVGAAFQLDLSEYIIGTFDPITFAITGTLPAGLTLDANTGVISGTTTTAESQSLTFTATDANTNTATSGSFTINSIEVTASVGNGGGPVRPSVRATVRTSN